MKIVPRLCKRGERFGLVILDPPTFGRAGGKVFRLESDLPAQVAGGFDLLEKGGWLLVACNYSRWKASELRGICEDALRGRRYSMVRGETPAEIANGAISWRVQRIGNV